MLAGKGITSKTVRGLNFFKAQGELLLCEVPPSKKTAQVVAAKAAPVAVEKIFWIQMIMWSRHQLSSQLQWLKHKQLLRKRISLTQTTMRTVLSLQQRSHQNQSNLHQCKLLLQKEINSFSEIQMTEIALNHPLNPRPQQLN